MFSLSGAIPFTIKKLKMCRKTEPVFCSPQHSKLFTASLWIFFLLLLMTSKLELKLTGKVRLPLGLLQTQ